MIDHRDPGDVELARRYGGAPTGDAVGLFDERDADPLGAGGGRGSGQVSRGHAAAGAVTEHEGGSRLVRRLEVDACAAVRGLELEDRQANIVAVRPSAGASATVIERGEAGAR